MVLDGWCPSHLPSIWLVEQSLDSTGMATILQDCPFCTVWLWHAVLQAGHLLWVGVSYCYRCANSDVTDGTWHMMQHRPMMDYYKWHAGLLQVVYCIVMGAMHAVMHGMSCNDGHRKLTMGPDDDGGSGGWWLGDMHGARTTWHAGGMRYTGECMEVQQNQNTEVLRSIAGDVSLRPGGGHTPLRGTGGRKGLWLQPCWTSWLCPGLAMGPRFQTEESEESGGRESGWDRVQQRMYYSRRTLGWAYGVYNMSTKVWWTK